MSTSRGVGENQVKCHFVYKEPHMKKDGTETEALQ
jgi:hypothetical protein